MKTLLMTDLGTGTTWLETDAEFSERYKNDRATVADMRSLKTGDKLFFQVDGERAIDPPRRLVCKRLYGLVGKATAADVLTSVFMLALFVAGLIGFAS